MSSIAAQFEWSVRVYWEDTDAGGVVYYANYLRFLERARSEWLRDLGVDQRAMQRDEAVQLVVRSVACDYLKPAQLDDELTVTATVTDIKKASFTFQQAILRGDTLLLTATVKAACLDANSLKPRRFPTSLADLLAPASASEPNG